MRPGERPEVAGPEERADAGHEPVRVVVHQQRVEPRLEPRASHRHEHVERLTGGAPAGIEALGVFRDRSKAPLRTVDPEGPSLRRLEWTRAGRPGAEPGRRRRASATAPHGDAGPHARPGEHARPEVHHLPEREPVQEAPPERGIEERIEERGRGDPGQHSGAPGQALRGEEKEERVVVAEAGPTGEGIVEAQPLAQGTVGHRVAEQRGGSVVRRIAEPELLADGRELVAPAHPSRRGGRRPRGSARRERARRAAAAWHGIQLQAVQPGAGEHPGGRGEEAPSPHAGSTTVSGPARTWGSARESTASTSGGGVKYSPRILRASADGAGTPGILLRAPTRTGRRRHAEWRPRAGAQLPGGAPGSRAVLVTPASPGNGRGCGRGRTSVRSGASMRSSPLRWSNVTASCRRTRPPTFPTGKLGVKDHERSLDPVAADLDVLGELRSAELELTRDGAAPPDDDRFAGQLELALARRGQRESRAARVHDRRERSAAPMTRSMTGTPSGARKGTTVPSWTRPAAPGRGPAGPPGSPG